MIVSPRLNVFVTIHHFSKRRHQNDSSALKTNEGMAFAIAENTDINSVYTTLPKNSSCLGEVNIHISRISDKRQPFLHPYDKGLIILAKNQEQLLTGTMVHHLARLFRPCYSKVVAMVPLPEDNMHDKLLVGSESNSFFI